MNFNNYLFLILSLLGAKFALSMEPSTPDDSPRKVPMDTPAVSPTKKIPMRRLKAYDVLEAARVGNKELVRAALAQGVYLSPEQLERAKKTAISNLNTEIYRMLMQYQARY